MIESGQFTPEMLDALRGNGDEDSQEKLAKFLDELIERLTKEGYLNLEAPPQMPAGHQPVEGKGSLSHAASKSVQFNLTDKGVDFLGYKALRHIMSSLGKSSFGSHDTPYLATGIESDGWSKQYEFGDVLNLDVNETLKRSMARTGSLDRADGSRLRRPDGAPGRVPLVVRDGADARYVALDDSVRRGSLHARQEGRARADASHPHAVSRRHASASCSFTIRRRRFRSPRWHVRRSAPTTPTPPKASSSLGASFSRRRRTCARS